MSFKVYCICMAIVAAYLAVGHFLPTPATMM